jgi:hypothetical protein
MGTLASEIGDLFLSRVSDYRLDNMFTTSGSLALGTHIEPYLLDAIIDFDICNQVLTYTVSGSATEGYFSLDLTLENKVILSQLMVLSWLSHDIQNIIQMNNHVTDKDYRTFSSAQSLSAKKDYYNSKKEEMSQKLGLYGYNKNSWSEWQNQIFA